MAIYRKKYVDVEAIVWDGKSFDVLEEFVHGRFHDENLKVTWTPYERSWVDESLWKLRLVNCNGERIIAPGDFVVKSPTGCVYPLCPESFHMSYELLEE